VSNGSAGTRIGQEMDLIATWNVFQPLQVGAGFGHIFPGQFLHIATPGVAYSFPYLMLGYKF